MEQCWKTHINYSLSKGFLELGEEGNVGEFALTPDIVICVYTSVLSPTRFQEVT